MKFSHKYKGQFVKLSVAGGVLGGGGGGLMAVQAFILS